MFSPWIIPDASRTSLWTLQSIQDNSWTFRNLFQLFRTFRINPECYLALKTVISLFLKLEAYWRKVTTTTTTRTTRTTTTVKWLLEPLFAVKNLFGAVFYLQVFFKRAKKVLVCAFVVHTLHKPLLALRFLLFQKIVNAFLERSPTCQLPFSSSPYFSSPSSL